MSSECPTGVKPSCREWISSVGDLTSRIAVAGDGSRASNPPRTDDTSSAPGTNTSAQEPYCLFAWTRAMSPKLEKDESATRNATSPPASEAAWIDVAAPYDQ